MNLRQHETFIIATSCALLHILLGLALLTPTPYSGGDNGSYLGLARSILEHGRYVELWDPAQRPVTLYPPLFPLALALALALGFKTWIQLKVVTLIISAIGVGVSLLWLRRVSGRATALAGGILLAVSPGILQQSSFVLSEGLFWVFTMLALWAFSHTEEPASADAAQATRWLIITALAAAAASLTRSAGLPMIVAIAAALVLRRRWRDMAVFAAVALTPVLLWAVRGRLVGRRGYGSYLTMRDPYRPDLGNIGVGDFGARIAANIRSYVGELTPSLIAGGEAPLQPLLIIILLIAATWGLVRLVRNRGALEIWVLLYVALVLIWPDAWAGERFVIALVPAFIYFAADLLHDLRRRNRMAGILSTIGVLLLVFAPIAAVLWGRVSAAAECRNDAATGDEFACATPAFGDFMRVADAAGRSLPAQSVVISRKPTLFYAQSRLRSVMHPLSSDTTHFFAAADSAGARYVVVDQLSKLAEMYLNPVIINASSHFCVEDSLSRDWAVMLRILPVPRRDAKPQTADGLLPMPDCKDLR